MLTRIYSQIEKADIIIADMTDKNANVFYEVGYAHAKDKLVLLITKDANDIPFDLKHYRHIVYGTSIADLKKQVKEDVEWALKEIEERQNSPFTISVKADGDLEKSKFSDTANIQLQIDFINKTSETVNIEAIYLYTKNGWKYKQNGIVCPNANSDLTRYDIKHQIRSPLPRLSKGNNWTQVLLEGTRVLALTYKGDELKEEYPLQGVIVIRVVTDKGSFDFETLLKLTISNIPF